MITIYTSHINNRIKYIVCHLFNNILGTDISLTDDPDLYRQSSGVCINYSEKDFGKGIRIYPHALLFEYGWSAHEIKMGKWRDWPCFFTQSQGDIPFDIFAASFYLLTRYEEYGSDFHDKFGRFPAENSLAYKEGFLQLPLVDRWAHELKKIILQETAEVEFIPRSFRMVSTFDIDHPFCYRNKGFLKNLAGGIRDLLKGRWKLAIERFRTQLHLQPDPYMDVLNQIAAFHQQHSKDYFLFIHVGPYGKYDRSTIYPQRSYYRYLHSLLDVRFGLHPSLRASFSLKRIRQEKEKLEKILDCDIRRNRQHFLRMRIPETFRTLLTLDFSEDFSLAYASQPGFRASTAIPFCFFDLQNDEATTLLIRPTIAMDATFISYLHIQPDETLKKLKSLIDECHLSGGDFTSLWHNSTLARPEKNPWYKIFVESMIYGISLEKELPLPKFK